MDHQEHSTRKTGPDQTAPVDLLSESRVSPKEYARRYLASDDGRPGALSTFFRHALKGVNGHKLETYKLGRKTFTTVEAIRRFSEALSVGRASRSATPTPTPLRRQRQAEQAHRQLGVELGLAGGDE